MNADSEVMRFFLAPCSLAETEAMMDRVDRHQAEHGFGLFAVERPEIAPFIGYIGLLVPAYEVPFAPCVEIGWRLAKAHWGIGLAPEGARAVLEYAFGPLGLAEVVSFTSALNQPSIRVMEKIGMSRDPQDDFDHPKVPEGHPLRRHVLYRIRSSQQGPCSRQLNPIPGR
jgi:RimJ/RimL family protein N-acetyltransferase